MLKYVAGRKSAVVENLGLLGRAAEKRPEIALAFPPNLVGRSGMRFEWRMKMNCSDLNFGIVASVLIAASVIAHEALAQPLSDQQTVEQIIRDSRYVPGHPCACPYDRARNGGSCGGRSAYGSPGGRGTLVRPRITDAPADGGLIQTETLCHSQRTARDRDCSE